MNAILDTHTFIWMDSDPGRVPAGVLSYLHNPACVVYLSVASIWEMVIKSMTGKLQLRAAVEDIVADHLRLTPRRLLPVRADHAYGILGLPAVHKDPFDRVLVAQARFENAVLLTDDPLIRQYPVRTDW